MEPCSIDATGVTQYDGAAQRPIEAETFFKVAFLCAAHFRTCFLLLNPFDLYCIVSRWTLCG